MFCIGKAKDCYTYSLRALELGESAKCSAAIGLAYSNLTWSCAELQLLDQGIEYGGKVLAQGEDLEPMAYYQSLGGLGLNYLFKGDSKNNLELGRILREFGESHSDLRSTVVGYICTSYAHYVDRGFSRSGGCCEKAVQLSCDPLFMVWPKLALANYYVQTDRFQEADEVIQEIIPFCQNFGMDYVVTSAQALEGVVSDRCRSVLPGMKRTKAGLRLLSATGRFYSRYLVEIGLAEIYFQIATRTHPLKFWSAIKNLGFILKEVPFAKRKAKAYLNRVKQVGEAVGATGFVHGHALLNLGLLHQLKRQPGTG